MKHLALLFLAASIGCASRQSEPDAYVFYSQVTSTIEGVK